MQVSIKSLGLSTSGLRPGCASGSGAPVSLLMLAVLLALAYGLIADPAAAAFPGQNGRILFSGYHSGDGYELYTVDSSGHDLRQLTSNTASEQYGGVISPDGTKIAFWSDRGDGGSNLAGRQSGNSEIYVMDADGKNQTRLTNNTPVADNLPFWSPDGEKIGFLSNRDPRGIYVMDADGQNPTLLASGVFGTPKWAANGKIVYTGVVEVTPGHFQPEIYVMDADGQNQTRLTNRPENEAYPDVSPDGTKIVFKSTCGINTTYLTNNCTDPDLLSTPDCNPAGNIETHVAIYIMGANGQDPTRIGPACQPGYSGPAFSPDGTKVVFTGDDGDLHTIDVDGQNDTRLFNIGGSDEFPNWGPVGPPPSAGIVVNTESDSDDGTCDALHCSLREAINLANAQAGPDNIFFDIPGGASAVDPHTIQPTSGLPTVTDAVVIDGTSEPDFRDCPEGPVVELDGTNAGAVDGIAITASGATVKGLTINRFGLNGIDLLLGDGHTIRCNRIGTDSTGTLDQGNGQNGIQAFGSSFNSIGGRSLSGRNLVSGNGTKGIWLRPGAFEGPSTNNTVEGNYIGTDADGEHALGNGTFGISVDGDTNVVGGDGDGAGNVVSANTISGLEVRGAGNTLSGNRIGTSADGDAALGNSFHGIEIYGANNTIGEPGAGNLVSGNLGEGIRMTSAGASGNVVESNFVGTFADGSGDLGNVSHGISMIFGASDNRVGGTDEGAGNVISGNNRAGVMTIDNASLRNEITQNSIYANTRLGIDHNGEGITANDTDDPDSGPNGLQNYPVLASAVSASGQTVIGGSFNSVPSTTYGLEFFSSPSCHPWGNGEGQTYLGSANLVTDAGGDADPFSKTIPVAGKRGHVLTATATDPDGNTSEFSACVTITPPTRVTGTKFNDTDGDGTQDAGESGLEELGDPRLRRRRRRQPRCHRDDPRRRGYDRRRGRLSARLAGDWNVIRGSSTGTTCDGVRAYDVSAIPR